MSIHHPVAVRLLSSLATGGLALAALGLGTSAAQATTAAQATQPTQATPSPTTVTPRPILETTDPDYPSNDPTHYYFADSGAAVASVADTSDGITVSAPRPQGGTAGVQITPPVGKPLTVGSYDITYDRQGLPLPTEPGVQTVYNSTDDFHGHLDVVDLASNAQGVFTRFDVVLEGLGEFSLGEPQASGVDFGQRHVEFGEYPVGFAPVDTPETLHNTSTAAVSVGKPVLAGEAKADYAVSSSTCGSSLAPGGSCSLVIDFSAKAGGPRDATLSIPIAGLSQVVSLSGSAPLGSTSIVTSGSDYPDDGATHTIKDGPYDIGVGTDQDGWAFESFLPYGETPNGTIGHDTVEAAFEKHGGGALATGSHTTQELPFETSGYGTDVTVFDRGCGTSEGTEDVKAFGLDAEGLPSIADITFTQKCEEDPTHVMTGTLLWQWRSDTTAPNAPTKVAIASASPHKATWTKSTSTDVTDTIARLVLGSGTGATPSSGTLLSSGTATSATLPSLLANTKYTVVVFAVDATGNVSKAATASIGTSPAVVSKPSPPTKLTATPGDGTVTLRFSPPASTGNSPITGYLVTVDGTVVTVKGSPYVITGLPDGVTDQFEVQAVNAVGQSQYATTDPVTPEPAAAP